MRTLSPDAAVPQTTPRSVTRIRRNVACALIAGAAHGLFVVAPSFAEPLPVPAGQALNEGVQLRIAGPLHAAGPIDDGNQGGTNWRDRIVEFLAPISAKCEAVAKQVAQQEGQQTHPGVVQELDWCHEQERILKERAPINALTLVISLVAGVALGGTFGSRA